MTSEAVLDREMQALLDFPDMERRVAMAWRPDLPIAVMERLGRDLVAEVRSAVAGHPALPKALIDPLSVDSESLVRSTIARRSELPRSVVKRLAADALAFVRLPIARRPDLPAALVERLADDPSEAVRAVVAERPDLPAALLGQMASDGHWQVRFAIARRPDLPAQLMGRLARDSEMVVRVAIAERDDLPPGLVPADPRFFVAIEPSDALFERQLRETDDRDDLDGGWGFGHAHAEHAFGAACHVAERLIASGWRGMKVGPGNTVAKRLECEASAPRYYVFDMTTCTDAESDLRTALGAEDEYEREMATRSLTDQCVLGDIATFDKHYLVRIAATERLTDPGLLADIAEDDEEEFVREAATERLQEIAAADADSGDALPAPGM